MRLLGCSLQYSLSNMRYKRLRILTSKCVGGYHTFDPKKYDTLSYISYQLKCSELEYKLKYMGIKTYQTTEQNNDGSLSQSIGAELQQY